MKDEEILSSEDLTKCVEFHGHMCPGLAIGFQAARTLMERLGVRRALDEELLATVETDACGADAIQVVTGCTFGKGNFVFKNYGKHAFSLMDRRKGKGARVCLRSDAFKMDPVSLSLSERVQKDEASAKESAQFRRLQKKRTQKILEADAESLFGTADSALHPPMSMAAARNARTAKADVALPPIRIPLPSHACCAVSAARQFDWHYTAPLPSVPARL